MPQEIWAVAAVTLIGGWVAGGLILAAGRRRQSDSAGAVRLSVVSIEVSVTTLLADVVLLLAAAHHYRIAWGLAAIFVLAYAALGGIVLVALLRRRLGRGTRGE